MRSRFRAWLWLRRGVQAAVLALFCYLVWTMRHPLDAFLNPRVFFQLDPLVMLFTAAAERLWLPGMLWALGTLVVTFVLGRVFCGWFCPLGTLQDLVAWVQGRWRRFREGEPGRWQAAKVVLLALLAVPAAAGLQFVWFFDPLAIVVRSLSYNIYPAVNLGLDRGLAGLLELTGGWLWLERVYYALQDSVLDVSLPAFPHAAAVLLMFAGVLAAALVRRRWWCRYLCPLGGLLGLVSRFALLRRRTGACPGACRVCRDLCRTNAITGDNRTRMQECVVCLDCLAGCASQETTFAFTPPRRPEPSAADGPGGVPLTRAEFLGAAGVSLLALAGCGTVRPAGVRTAVRPPGALPEAEFVQRCVRCGNCLKVCLTNVLQPSMPDAGWAGLWTPYAAIPGSYCEYHCTLCGQVCPTGALAPLTREAKVKTRIGTARILEERCLPWAESKDCIVCEEHCPVPEKAIKVETRRLADGRLLKLPRVDPALCIGCGLCANKCPVRPGRAIVVEPHPAQTRRRTRRRGA